MQNTSTSLDADVYELCSIASSNETADNLPGPGRLLGNLYDSAGRRLEGGLGRVAVQMGHGPRPINNQTLIARLSPRSSYIDVVSNSPTLDQSLH